MTREPTATGNNFLYIKNAPPAVINLVQTFYNLQKKLAKTCLYVADELKNLNINEPNPRFHGIDELTRRLQIILESNQDAYEANKAQTTPYWISNLVTYIQELRLSSPYSE